MRGRLRQLRWFGGLYLASLAAIALVTLVIRKLLSLSLI
jgi:hypothetical protein